tara:strand:- start:36 stop:605 length:570 start_codon:yes stop_codon:yes gene_type:complete
MIMINIARSVILALIGLAPFATISIFFIITLIASPNADSGLSLYIGDNLVNSEDLADAGDDVQDVIFDIFRFLRELNIALLSLTLIISLGWSVGSHYLNVDAPGKAKIYSIHWLIFTGIFIALVFGILFWFTQTTAYQAEQYLSGGGKTIIIFASLIFYISMYYAGVLLGTARFTRSSVLLANKLPGGF